MAGATATPTSYGFYYGTAISVLTSTATATASGSNFSATLTGLNASTTYYYKAFVVVNGQEFSGNTLSFVTSAASSSTAQTLRSGWLELPAGNTDSGHTHYLRHYASFGGNSNARNYTCMYDDSYYASLWVAWPLCEGHTGSGRTGTWGYDSSLSTSLQTSVKSSYGVQFTNVVGQSDSYARGHQCPNADRSGVTAMQTQTYVSTNSTPQRQNRFNGYIWSSLENAVRGWIPDNDTLYVVTGAAFRKVGGSETITHITNQNDSKSIPVPNYYWKAVLKVKRTNGTVTSASAIGFWYEHKDYTVNDYTTGAVSVDQIEAWTGFDLYANLPTSVATSAESNTSLTTFTSF